MTVSVNYPEEFKGFAITDPKDWASPKLTSIQPKIFGPNDVDIEIEACGICASELFTLKNEWSHDELACLSSTYGPKCQIVGHEVVGKVVKIGSECKTDVKLGQRVGLGAQASCCAKEDCSRCNSGNEQYCPQSVGTYASRYPDGYVSQGGYASHVRAHEQLVFPIPDGIESHLVAPLQCGGLTVYSPIKRGIQDILDAGKEQPKVGIIGLGGLGHMAVMISKALGAEVTTFSRSNAKKDDAFKMGTDKFIATGEDKDWESKNWDQFHLILNCASGTSAVDLDKLLKTLKVNRSFINVGLPHVDEKFEISPFTFFKNGSTIGSSCLGSRAEAIELFELAAKHNIKPWVETIKIGEEGVHEGLTRLDQGDVKYRFTLVGFNEYFGTGK
ncbi:Cinnamyl alcohol dehydrogenase 2 [Wickerhamomyces ciferrii]|uniref:Cinnamyl alcohol dehydrogenase 2 n=1 Tax=Wickerhamomyces ciferrii (strain ATCC 14091 / BCRC 22168 / CBS 111 / JCM 3599 / NBRC 0793 / NRRL Y-1031 F-60-10) TaxID=1206466 RepID=K0KGN8_WICCF|nr:Cinnamyl alcohol dehydrogenase 2 [Wickerhamomyces ciferrii]CCH44320.1 Cinnamyl alcohol dehydrogenase 2 [Wickerhamomyces ciferrii]